jgi:hypothetical protein
VFIAWADLEDLYDNGKTPIVDAHAALRQAATQWLARPPAPELDAYIEEWIAHAGQVVGAIIKRDGEFWTSPSSGARVARVRSSRDPCCPANDSALLRDRSVE